MNLEAAAKFKAELEALINEVLAREAAETSVGFIGEMAAPTLEHNVRKFFLNRLLMSLGWKLDSVIEEARVRHETTLFLDYLGAHPDTKKPVLILEAKAWEKPFITASNSANTTEAEELVVRALNYVKTGKNGKSPVTAEWTDWISKLLDYVRDLKTQSDHVVKRVVISSGKWLIIFTEPEFAFLDKSNVNAGNILVFYIDAFVRCSDQIFRQISYAELIGVVPAPLRPTQLSTYIVLNSVRRVFKALWIRWLSAGSAGALDPFPQIFVYPAAIVERDDGALLQVIDTALGRSVLPADAGKLSEYLEAFKKRSDTLIDAIAHELNGSFPISALEQFPGFPAVPMRGSNQGLVPTFDDPRTQFLRPWSDGANEFLLVIGNASHFILEQPTVPECIGHDWVDCRDIGENLGDFPILGQSVDPKAYYSSAASHHCAHRVIHDRRAAKCYIAVFEKFLCCKTCIFQGTCWAEPVAPPLPCGAPANAESMPHREARVAARQIHDPAIKRRRPRLRR